MQVRSMYHTELLIYTFKSSIVSRVGTHHILPCLNRQDRGSVLTVTALIVWPLSIMKGLSALRYVGP